VSTIGPLFSPHLIEEGAIATLQKWLPFYAGVAKEEHGLELPPIKSWGLLDNTYDRWPEQALPALVVVAEGIGRGGSPEKHSGGYYRASWGLGVVVVVQHPKTIMARKIAQIYGACIRGALLQRRSLGAGGQIADWLDEASPYGVNERRTRAASENVFSVTQDEVVNWQMGPKTDEPPATVPIEPEITEVDVDAEVNE
jgi:hypothetical protein